MKNKLYYAAIIALIVFISFPLRGLSQSMILAGQTEGDYIHYTDYEPDSLAVLTELIDHFDLDIDFDGNPDLGFYVKADGNVGWFQFWSYVTIYNEKLELMRGSGNNAKELSYGDTINNNMVWTGDSLSSLVFRGIWEGYDPPYDTSYYFGEFESGYLGFKIENQWETYYGWIYLYVDAGSGVAEITSMSSAFYSITIGINESPFATTDFKIFPNPCKGKFTLNIPESDLKERNFKIFNAFGGQLMTGIFEGSTVDIDAGNLHPGVYFVEVYEASKPVYRGKIIIQ